MLYDNAQILELLAFAHAETPSPIYAARARDTFAWLMREMRAGGAFAASLDADQDGEEGLFYVWTADAIDAALGRDAEAFKLAYDVREGGNWEGRNVLRMQNPCDPETEAALAPARAKLFALRESRPRPGLDDKVLADWNGLMIAALGARLGGVRRARNAGRRARGVRLSRRQPARRRRGGSSMRGARAGSARPECSTTAPASPAPRWLCSRRRGSRAT